MYFSSHNQLSQYGGGYLSVKPPFRGQSLVLQSPKPTRVNYRELATLTPQKCVHSQFQRLEVHKQDVCRAMLPLLKALGENRSFTLLSSGAPDVP